MNKIVSIIIPVYNVAAYLPQCLDSVYECMVRIMGKEQYEKLKRLLKGK